MSNGFDEGLQERLKQAEMAEREMQRLHPLASEAPQLRLQKQSLSGRRNADAPRSSPWTKPSPPFRRRSAEHGTAHGGVVTGGSQLQVENRG